MMSTIIDIVDNEFDSIAGTLACKKKPICTVKARTSMIHVAAKTGNF